MHVKTSHGKKYAKSSIKKENGNCEINEEFTESNKHFTNSLGRKSKIKKSDEVFITLALNLRNYQIFVDIFCFMLS